MQIVGTIASGRGKGRSRVMEVQAELERLMGSPLVPGTLNLVLDRPIEFLPVKAALISGSKMFWWAELEGQRCLAYRTKGFPLHIVEIVSTSHLRSEKELRDGDRVSFCSSSARPVRPVQRLG